MQMLIVSSLHSNLKQNICQKDSRNFAYLQMSEPRAQVKVITVKESLFLLYYSQIHAKKFCV